eukprot:CAMPEP_0204155154 /NCGR_PEP_ID=MMETSP0361-20130328/29344_1 /ASSEMBLY_ACC=CAM_ASM_000343 /TAXON_ID=268821 /ORGANISM="Scrippsiella Hangoei, Strain SHTV-5" /LENGTH=102 /DNA_ID=CAMNT_0051110565 /DNA_START=175 /DNA_END=480 /DNA_ORIENTATION=-
MSDSYMSGTTSSLSCTSWETPLAFAPRGAAPAPGARLDRLLLGPGVGPPLRSHLGEARGRGRGPAQRREGQLREATDSAAAAAAAAAGAAAADSCPTSGASA